MSTNNYSIKGIIEQIGDTETKGSGNFMVREIVLRIEDGKYPQLIPFQLTQDRTDLADNFSEGQAVEVFFNLRGREYNGRYFGSINCWKIVAEQGTSNVPEIPRQEVNGFIDENGTPNEIELPF